MTTNRRLAAIMVADVVGYSRLMEADEAGTLAALKERRKNVLEPVVKAHGGRIVKVMGDGALVEFTSAVNAVQGAIDMQKKMSDANEGVLEARGLRVGIAQHAEVRRNADFRPGGPKGGKPFEKYWQPFLSPALQEQPRPFVQRA